MSSACHRSVLAHDTDRLVCTRMDRQSAGRSAPCCLHAESVFADTQACADNDAIVSRDDACAAKPVRLHTCVSTCRITLQASVVTAARASARTTLSIQSRRKLSAQTRGIHTAVHGDVVVRQEGFQGLHRGHDRVVRQHHALWVARGACTGCTRLLLSGAVGALQSAPLAALAALQQAAECDKVQAAHVWAGLRVRCG